MKPLCVIPARMGSKRLAKKNLAQLDGRPLLAWTIEAAKNSGVFDAVYVSTESAEVADQAGKWGAIVPFMRDARLATDTVTNVAVSLDMHDRLADAGHRYDAVVCLQPSSPMRTAQDIAGSWARFCESNADFLTSVTPIDPHYFHWALRDSKDTLEPWFGNEFMRVRQELPTVFRPNGAIKIAKLEPLRKQDTFIGRPMIGFTMPEERSIHVATAFDLNVCQALLA
jgi:CMP-N,N'-diacetyllegionaminic acid synthase